MSRPRAGLRRATRPPALVVATLPAVTPVAHDLRAPEIRVLGCLLEKQRTTPDAYPLSLNSLRLACNQSTNRDPVVEYDETLIRDALHRLQRRGFTRLASGAGSRAAKYRHLLADALPMDAAEQATICVLMLRGAQTPGELKQRTERMHAFASLDDVHATLAALIERELVSRLERRPGQKEERYEQLLGVEQDEREDSRAPVATLHNGAAAAAAPSDVAQPAAQPPAHAGAAPSAHADVAALERRVAVLEREVAALRASAAGDAPMRDPV
jgi:hypothetical protein